MTRGRNRAASGQGRSLRDPVKRAVREAGVARKDAPETGATKAKPSPRKTEPARASAATDKAAPSPDRKPRKPLAKGKPAQAPRSVRPAPDLARDDAIPRKRGRPVKAPGLAAVEGVPDRIGGGSRRPSPSVAPPRPRTAGELRYIAFHKPYGVLSQFTAESGQRALAEFNLPEGVYAAGRLDMDSEGLLLLSNDGNFINRLLSPMQGHARSYLVQVEGEPDDAALATLRQGVRIRDYTTRPARVERLTDDPGLPPRDPPIRERRHIPTTWLRITLTEGRNRQVRRMTAAVGHPTLRLVRVSIGDLSLGDLRQGTWREVKRKDVLPGG